ncbi:hypothetical protein FA10DRAFT_215567, partial [Acaromyces ingoldii]
MSVPLSSAFFAGGVLVGATGAFLLRPSPSPAPTQPSSPPPPPPGAPQTLAGHSLIDASSLTLTDAAGQPVVRAGSVGPIVDLLRNTAYISAYDRRLRHPAWTAEHLTAASFAPPASGGGDGGSGGVDRRYSVFKEDPRIPELFRARLADYFRSGYDRGHMVPAADAKTSQTAMDETFFLSNIAPQVGEGFNRDYWAHLEDFTRRLAKASADGRAPRWKNVYVFTVPLYLPRSYLEPAPTATGGGSSSAVDERRERFRVSYEVIGSPPSISVPTHFAKVIYALPASSSSSLLSRGGGGVLGAFVLPNARIPNEVPLRQFLVPVESVERAAGLTLFSDDVKRGARPLCDSVDCSIVVREFNDIRKKTLSAPPPTP